MYIGSFYFNTEENILLPADTPINQLHHNRHVLGWFYCIALSCMISQQEVWFLLLHVSSVEAHLVSLWGGWGMIRFLGMAVKFLSHIKRIHA